MRAFHSISLPAASCGPGKASSASCNRLGRGPAATPSARWDFTAEGLGHILGPGDSLKGFHTSAMEDQEQMPHLVCASDREDDPGTREMETSWQPLGRAGSCCLGGNALIIDPKERATAQPVPLNEQVQSAGLTEATRLRKGRCWDRGGSVGEEAEAAGKGPPHPAWGYLSFEPRGRGNALRQQVHFSALQSMLLHLSGSPHNLSELFPDGFYLYTTLQQYTKDNNNLRSSLTAG